MDPANKIVIITGASSGIGAEAVRVFARAGAHVVLAARDEEKLAHIVRDIPGQHLVVPTDITDRMAIEALVAATVATFGRIDVIVHNAGVGLAAPVAELSEEAFQRALAVDLFGPMLLTQAALPIMRQQRRGQLIYISSVVGLRALPYLGGYAAAKAALDRLIEALRVELRGSGIAVTLVRPGTTRTHFAEHRLGHGRERRRINARAATPAHVAAVILRAVVREPRVAYTSWRDRVTVLTGLTFPRLTDRLLARSFTWEAHSEERE